MDARAFSFIELHSTRDCWEPFGVYNPGRALSVMWYFSLASFARSIAFLPACRKCSLMQPIWMRWQVT
eukprot:6477947-Amphidinium_carterae.2